MSMPEMAAKYSLDRVGARPPLTHYLKEVWRRRDFIFSLAKFRIQSENERNRLGMLWVLLRPIFSALIYGLVFGLVLGSMRPEGFVPYVIIGVFLLEFFNSSMNGGAKSIISNSALVQSLPFPRLVLPVSTVLQNLLNFVPTLALMIILTMLWGARPEFTWFLLIPLVLIFWVFNQGVALIFARLTVHLRDLSQLVPYISRMIFYTSGVFFDPATVLDKYPTAAAVYDWHPLYEVLAIARGILLPEYEIPVDFWWKHAIWAVVILCIGVVFFWKAEERYGRDD
ncbi:ABC transporter permease [Brevibacterium luteolum]|uniref:ABC transporter permease n=1 Tax=Brevibacterium luteolum TaxID=199591 RepID=UPI00223C3466|nr:ABC transporter permease [Brevibacterium luteolum]MCT1657414.1 ABC transporter permease [Brevibacterium luteolum]